MLLLQNLPPQIATLIVKNQLPSRFPLQKLRDVRVENKLLLPLEILIVKVADQIVLLKEIIPYLL